MVSVLSKKYAKALCSLQDPSRLETTLISLQRVAMAMRNEQVKDIVASTQVDQAAKFQLFGEIASSSDEQVVNLLKILIEKKRLSIVEAVADEIRAFLADKSGKYEGRVVANFDVEAAEMSRLEQVVSSRLKKSITLSFAKSTSSEFDGIKVELDDLGYEIEIDKKRLKNNIIEHILRSNKI